MESNGTESKVQDDNNRSGNDTDANDADIRPIYGEEPMDEVQLTTECNISAIGQQHTEQPKIINEGSVDQHTEEHRFSPNKSYVVYEKTSPGSDLRWKPTGILLNTVGLSWVPTRKMFTTCTSKDDSESTHGSKVDISKIRECKQTLDLSVDTSLTGQQKQRIDFSAVKMEILLEPTSKKLLKERMVNAHHKEVLKASTSKGVKPSTSDMDHGNSDNVSSSTSEDLNFRGFITYNLKTHIYGATCSNVDYSLERQSNMD
nr:hypothetical protein [Tanacetum cinerariifolium]